jgi:hypothetical protein
MPRRGQSLPGLTRVFPVPLGSGAAYPVLMHRRALSVAAVAAVLLTGCASAAAPSSGQVVLADVRSALTTAGSVRVQGPTGYSGDTFDLHVQGDNVVGTVSMGADYDAEFVAVDGDAWLLPPPNFFVEAGATEAEAAPLRGRYMTMPGDDWREQVPGSLADVLALLPAAADVVGEVERTSVDGRPVLVLTTRDGGQLVVEARSPHHPVRLLLPAEEEEGAWGAPERMIRFSDVGKRRTVTAPDNPIPAEVLGG